MEKTKYREEKIKERREDYCFQPSMNFSQLSLRMREWMEGR
jgi:hypothetical protein